MKNPYLETKFSKFISLFLTLSLFLQFAVLLPVSAEAATTIFSDSFGTGNSDSSFNENPSWTEGGDGAEKRKPDANGNDTASSDGGRFAIVYGQDGYICRVIDVTGYQNINLSFYWRGDSDAENNDKAEVKYKVGGNCGDANGWATFHNVTDLRDFGWQNVSDNFPSNVKNNSFALKFKVDSSQDLEHFRFDGILITGDPLVENTSELCSDQIDNDGDGYIDLADSDCAQFIPADSDGDQVPDYQDNCPSTANPDQADIDDDGVGDACDNCPQNVNIDQADSNLNGVGNVCEAPDSDPEPETATIVATKIICPTENLLPNWGDGDPAMQQITSDTAGDFLEANPTCYQDKWTFEWAPNGTSNPGDDVGVAGGAWTSFGGSTDVPAGNLIWVREQVSGAYVSFSGDTNPNDGWSDESAEIYCSSDVLNYDNYDWVNPVEAGETYYCVAFNAPKEVGPICNEQTLDLYSDVDMKVTKIDETSVDQNAVLVTPTSITGPNWTADVDGADNLAKWIWFEDPATGTEVDRFATFEKQFNLTGTPQSATLDVASDNGYEVYVNGELVGSDPAENNFSYANQDQYTASVLSALVSGNNTLKFVVKNQALVGYPPLNNPGGLLFKLHIVDKVCDGDNEPGEPEKLQVKIYKYLDGEQANSDTAQGYAFPMRATWSWPESPLLQSSSGSGVEYFLSQSGHGGSGAYQAFTSVMNAPAQYQTYEVTTEISEESEVLPIGAQCENGKFRLLGYRFGDSLEEAEEADLSTAYPDFTNLHEDKYVIVENEKCPETATVNICKIDQNDESLSGWTLMLKGESVQAGLSVSTNISSGVNSNLLSADVSYLAEVLGTWLNQGGANPVDAEYSTIDGWATHMDGYTGYQTDILELQINSIFDPNSNWGAYNSSHRYAMSFTPSADGPANFRIFDGTGTTQNEGWFGDNIGNLNVDLYQGYAGITGENGCISFVNVPHGNYMIDELPQDGWSNVSGLGEVVIDEPTETFTIQNTNGELPEVQCTEEGYHEENNECVLDDSGSDGEDEDGPAPTLLSEESDEDNDIPGGRRHDVSGLFGGGLVLGASTDGGFMCEPYLNEYIKLGANNNPEEVKKLQIFLNQFFEADNPVTGFYGPITYEMVKKFQDHQKDAILLPWAIYGLPTDEPTGYVYKTTKRWINILKCPEMIANFPIPSLP